MIPVPGFRGFLVRLNKFGTTFSNKSLSSGRTSGSLKLSQGVCMFVLRIDCGKFCLITTSYYCSFEWAWVIPAAPPHQPTYVFWLHAATSSLDALDGCSSTENSGVGSPRPPGTRLTHGSSNDALL